MYDARNSVYCYKDTNVLINKLDIKDPVILSDYERRVVSLKLLALHKKGITGIFDVNHFISIHKFLFEDIYPFAGEFRCENIAKDNFSFAEFEYIEPELNKLLSKLKEENYLAELDKTSLAKRLAYYWAELNVLHPFREGNGRTTREFLRQLALKNGYNLDLQNVDANELLDASKKSVIDENDLSSLLIKILDK